MDNNFLNTVSEKYISFEKAVEKVVLKSDKEQYKKLRISKSVLNEETNDLPSTRIKITVNVAPTVVPPEPPPTESAIR